MPDRAAIRIDLHELNGLASALKHIQPDLAKEIGAGLVKGADPVRLEASRRAWAASSRIPRTIKIRRRGFSVSIVAGGPQAPTAAPFENRGVPGSFRHPVFGNREVWVSQKAHPFLWPAFVAKEEVATKAVVDALDTLFKKAGFR